MDVNKALSDFFGTCLYAYIEKAVEDTEREDFPFIITNRGIKFRIGWPEAVDMNIMDIAHALSRYCRFTGHIDAPLYSVAQHSVLVSRTCDPKDALWGLLHDAAEAYVGDVSSPLKNMPGMEAFKHYERLTMRRICCRYGLLTAEPKSVKHADMRLLLTEMRDLFSCDEAHKWAAERYDTWPPLDEKIIPWNQKTAYDAFLYRFQELTKIGDMYNLMVTPEVKTNRDIHEEAAGMGLCPEFFALNNIEPDAAPQQMLVCTECGRKYNPDAWDPMGGDCPNVTLP